MGKQGPSKTYAHRLLRTVQSHMQKTDTGPFPVDQGQVIKTGASDSDIVIDLFNSDVNLEGDEVQWMVDEERLEVGDTVTVVYDKAGDPIVVAAIYQADLEGRGPDSAVAIAPGAHSHRHEVHVPTGPQATFVAQARFKHVTVHENGLLRAPGIHYSVRTPYVVMNAPVAASSIVQLELRVDL